MLTPVNRSGHATKPRRSWNSARGDAEIAGPSCTGEGGLIAGSSFSLHKEGVFGPPWEGPWPRHWKVLVKWDTCEVRGGGLGDTSLLPFLAGPSAARPQQRRGGPNKSFVLGQGARQEALGGFRGAGSNSFPLETTQSNQSRLPGRSSRVRASRNFPDELGKCANRVAKDSSQGRGASGQVRQCNKNCLSPNSFGWGRCVGRKKGGVKSLFFCLAQLFHSTDNF